MAGLLRWLGALLLIGSLALPMSTCTSAGPVAPDGTPGAPQVTLTYAWTPDRLGEPAGYVILLAFAWPLGACLLARRRDRGRGSRLLFWLQVVPMAGTAYVIAALGWGLGRPASGAWLAVVGLAVFGLGWIVDAVRRGLARRARPPREP